MELPRAPVWGPYCSFSFPMTSTFCLHVVKLYCLPTIPPCSASHKSQQFLKYMLKHDMTLLTDWYKANQLSLNVNKTVLVKFWSNNTPFNIQIKNSVITNSKSARFLGIIINENLTWNEHVITLHNKLLSNNQLLSNACNLLPRKVLQNIYYAHIYSHMTYGLSIWGSMTSKRNMDDIYKIQTNCVKFITKNYKNYSRSELFLQNALSCHFQYWCNKNY